MAKFNKEKLLKSNVFCILPWLHLHIWPDSRVFPCCMTPMDKPIGNLEEDTLINIFNNDQMKQMRLSMLNGEKIDSCSRCYEIEFHKGGSSLRKGSNEGFLNFINLVDETQTDGSISNPKMRYWDVRFSNLCNFKCRSCGPDLSSGWYSDNNKVYDNKYAKVKYAGGSQEKLWDEIKDHIPFIEKIYFAGGEPMMMEEHYKILKILIDVDKTDIEIEYNTNVSKLKLKNDYVIDLWRHFKTIYVGASIDGYGHVAEYVRKGTIWSEVENNLYDIKEKTPHVGLGYNYTISVLNVFHFPNFIRYMISKNLLSNNFLINYVLHPEHLRVQILPSYLKDKIKISYNELLNELKNNHSNRFPKIEREITSFISFLYEKDLTHLKDRFLKNMELFDQVRNEKLLEIVPELMEFYNE